MANSYRSTLERVVLSVCAPEETEALLRTVHVSPSIFAQTGHTGAAQTAADHTVAAQTDTQVSRAVLTQALNLLLFRDLLVRVPTGASYVADCVSEGRRIVFDHGALRTVALSGMGALPAGEEAITRVLMPLGYQLGKLYPLDRLGMTGRSYTHQDYPEELPQFFVSELHPERFSSDFQAAVARVTASSRDPLTVAAKKSLDTLARDKVLPLEEASALLPVLLACFQRQHATPSSSDYEMLLRESAEMAWICTEGNAFNHATDRVASLDRLVEAQRRLGRPLKDTIETSRSGRIRQTAYRADPVERDFVDSNGVVVKRVVPGSFFEFIQREHLRDAETGQQRLDLSFDSGNAQGIFKMTAAA
jgi:hypothetical protein